ncbi:MAG TPA: hypothetical protein DEB39_10685 [Planctomycetaceae bacterium]|nr:hypothetical protein [Planctomycetaceae bacterium]
MYFAFLILSTLPLSESVPESQAVVLPASVVSQAEKFANPPGTAIVVQPGDEDSKKHDIKNAIRIDVKNQPQNPWSVGFQIPTDKAVDKDEVLLFRFKTRHVGEQTETGGAVLRVLFEKGSSPYSKSLSKDVEVEKNWTEFSFPLKSVDSYKTGEAKVGFQLGFQIQSLEIADLTLESYGKDCDIRSLPQSGMTYAGRESHAAWRKEAEKRIDAHRKGAVAIHVCDAAGNPVENVVIELKMLRHAFPWGTAVTTRRLLQQDEDGNRYRAIVERYFNRVSFENDMKWHRWDNDKNRDDTFKAIEWLRARNIDIRGHCLLWPSWRNSPAEYRSMADEPERLRQAVNNRLEKTVLSLRGIVVAWDVLNEPFDNNDLMQVLGDEETVEWFKRVRRLDANAKLYVNDYSILSEKGLHKEHQDHLEKTIRFLQARGAPLSGIGLQSHFVEAVTPPERIKKILDRFAAPGLPMTITEHDIDTEDEQLQADYTRDFLTMAFSHPSVEAISCWGFWEKSHWRPKGAYFRSDWSLKPAGQAWIDQTTKRWWTHERGVSDQQGNFETRGFLGDYEIRVRIDDNEQVIRASIPKQGTDITIMLP